MAGLQPALAPLPDVPREVGLLGKHRCVALGVYSGLGDIICALPAIMRIRAQGRRVVLVMSVGLARVAGELVAQYLPKEDVLTVQWPPGKNLKSVWGLFRALHREGVESFLVSPHPQVVHASRKLPWLLAALRLGGVRVVGAEADPRAWVYSRRIAVDRSLPIATREWSFVSSVLGARDGASFDWRLFAREKGARTGGVMIHVGASKPNRRLPTATLLGLIALIGARCPVRVLGLPSELAELQAAHAQTAPVAGADVAFVSTSLVEAFSLLRGMDCLISMDSAFAHLAAACDVPQIIAFGPSDPGSNRPVSFVRQYGVRQDQQALECQPCGLHTCVHGDYRCMGLIRAEQLYAAVLEVLAPHEGTTEPATWSVLS